MELVLDRAQPYCLLHSGFWFGLLFEPEDGGDIYLRNLGWVFCLHKTWTATPQNATLYICLNLLLLDPFLHTEYMEIYVDFKNILFCLKLSAISASNFPFKYFAPSFA
jgi:hypothetical protein